LPRLSDRKRPHRVEPCYNHSIPFDAAHAERADVIALSHDPRSSYTRQAFKHR